LYCCGTGARGREKPGQQNRVEGRRVGRWMRDEQDEAREHR
jgi:hypothetical protein